MAKRGIKDKSVKQPNAADKYYALVAEQIETSKNREKEAVERIKKDKPKFYWGLGISLVASLILTYLFFKSYNLSLTLLFILFGMFFIVSMMVSEFIITKNERKYFDNIKLLFELLTLFILISQLLVLVNQNSLMLQQASISAKQTEILDRTSQSNLPDAFVASLQGKVSYSYSSLVDHNQAIAIGVTNVGKAMIPALIISISSPIFFGFQQNAGIDEKSNEFGVSNLKSLDYKFTWFEFYSTNITAIKLGNNELTFKVVCPFCRKPIDYQNVTFCIFNQSSEEECK